MLIKQSVLKQKINVKSVTSTPGVDTSVELKNSAKTYVTTLSTADDKLRSLS